jgi:small subunit ribosomal protein S17
MSENESPQVVKGNKKVLTGLVVSDKMDKTIVIAVTSRKIHGLYRKYLTQTRKFKAHDERDEAHTGDTVKVVETRPLSKEKRWRLLEIIERAK